MTDLRQEKENFTTESLYKVYVFPDSFYKNDLDICVYMSYIVPDQKNKKTEPVCVLTGPFKDKYKTFREKYLGKTRLFTWIHYRYNLLVGHTDESKGGWLFPQSKIDILKETLEKEKIQYDIKQFDQNIRNTHKREKKREQMRRYREKKNNRYSGLDNFFNTICSGNEEMILKFFKIRIPIHLFNVIILLT